MGLFNNINKIVLVVEYNGRQYCGFQWQKGAPTIQSELEKAILKLTGEQRRVIAACRTDTGVHARGQVVSFRTESRLPPKTFTRGLNHYLPEDIAIAGACSVSEKFNVRKDAARREYRYYILNRPSRSPLAEEQAFHVAEKLNIDLMDRAAGLLVGKHDLISFATAWDRQESTVRQVFESGVTAENGKIVFKIVAGSFLTHQVRNTVGTLLRVGTGRMDIKEFKGILEARKVSTAGPAAPAHGLCLIQVVYPEGSEFKYENLCA